VSWQFDRKGVVVLPKSVGEDELMSVALEAGAEDLADEGSDWLLTAAPADLHALKTALDAADIPIESADLEMVPNTRVEIDNESTAKRILKLIEVLEDHDDVQNVWSNVDIPDEILETIEI